MVQHRTGARAGLLPHSVLAAKDWQPMVQFRPAFGGVNRLQSVPASV